MNLLVDSKVRKTWNEQSASKKQLVALRRLASKSGRTFSIGITQGEAWRRIARATVQVPDPLRTECAPPWYVPQFESR